MGFWTVTVASCPGFGNGAVTGSDVTANYVT